MIRIMPMIKKNTVIWLVSALMLVAGSGILYYRKNQQAVNDLLPVGLHAIKIADGWGYEVLVDKKIYIHQDCIPAISSFKRFSSEAEALQIGQKVVEKIKQGHKPSITEQDLIESHIRY